VAQHVGPVGAALVKKPDKQESTDINEPNRRALQLFEEDRRRATSAPAQLRPRELRPDRSQSCSSWSPMETPRVSMPSGGPPYLPVTPVSSSRSRKRPRYYDTPMIQSPHSYNGHPSSQHPPTNTPPGRVYPHPGPFSSVSSSAMSLQSRPSMRSHHVPSSGQGGMGLLGEAASHLPHEFDLFNGELLSDSEREGANSPQPFHSFLSSFYNRDHRDSL
jgi:hypothetical protein